MPAMTASHLAGLWSAAAPGCGLLPWLGGYPEPLPGIYPAEARAIATGMLACADVSLTAFARALLAAGLMKKFTIGSPDAILYENCNSPADWQRHATDTARNDD
jgi:molybdopterin-guanine dinucleotide biosynthesis protein A